MILFGLTTFLIKFSSLFAFLSGFFVGDSSFFGFAFLASQKIISFWKIAIFSFLGVFFAEFTFYLIGKSKFFKKFTQMKIFRKLFRKADKIIDFISGKNIFLALFYMKIFIGTKFLVCSYLGQKKISILKYLLSSFLSTLLWASILFSAGFLAGEGFKGILFFFKNIHLILGTLIIFGIILIHFHGRAHKYIIKKIGGKNAKLSPNKKR